MGSGKKVKSIQNKYLEQDDRQGGSKKITFGKKVGKGKEKHQKEKRSIQNGKRNIETIKGSKG